MEELELEEYEDEEIPDGKTKINGTRNFLRGQTSSTGFQVQCRLRDFSFCAILKSTESGLRLPISEWGSLMRHTDAWLGTGWWSHVIRVKRALGLLHCLKEYCQLDRSHCDHDKSGSCWRLDRRVNGK